VSSPTDAPLATETAVASPDSIPDRTELRSVVDDDLIDQVRASGGDVPVQRLDSALQDMRAGTSFGGTIDGRTRNRRRWWSETPNPERRPLPMTRTTDPDPMRETNEAVGSSSTSDSRPVRVVSARCQDRRAGRPASLRRCAPRREQRP
jgi:hypothetical protein